ncbi:ABATE domain-containing protein [Actinomadura flavalba]|uniref:ABATE domain-containing protein n=1 Tax=Actinomadura flavalba TaxID=1120938 RepID=UPI0012DF18E3|nr:ABATE domain-containing protein [Actinomadura flavalba]
MDLSSYADLALGLVNTGAGGHDALRDLDGLRAVLALHPHFGGRVLQRDLGTMRELRDQIREIFAAAARGDDERAVDRLNAMLIQHPVHPQISGHDGQNWHLHLNESGSAPDMYAARAAMGLAVKINQTGLHCFGLCTADGCDRAYFGTGDDHRRDHCPSHVTVA